MRELQIANNKFNFNRDIFRNYLFSPLWVIGQDDITTCLVCVGQDQPAHTDTDSVHTNSSDVRYHVSSVSQTKHNLFIPLKPSSEAHIVSPLILALGAGLKIFPSVVGSGAVIKVLCCLQVILTQMLIIYNKARTTRKNRSSIILIAVILVLWNNDNWPFCFVVTQI